MIFSSILLSTGSILIGLQSEPVKRAFSSLGKGMILDSFHALTENWELRYLADRLWI